MNIFGITLDGTDLWLLAIVGACLAWLIPHRLSVARERQNTFRAASSALHSAFNDALVAMESKGGMTINTRDLLLAAHIKHSAAIVEFRRHIFWRRRGLDKCWQKHHYGHGFDAQAFEIPEKDRLYLIYLAITDAAELAAKTLAVKNIHALLRFSKET